MNQISSSWSLFWKVFFPTFYLVFFGLGNLIFWLSNLENYDQSELLTNRLIFGSAFVLGALLFSRTLWKLKRVDMDDQFVYVSNYFKTAKYSFDQIERITENKFLSRKIVRVYLTGKGVFGNRFGFVPDRVRYDHFFKAHEILSQLYR